MNDPILRAGAEVTQAYNANNGFDGTIDRPKQPSKFGGILRGIAGAAAGMIPGVGGMISGMIRGGSGGPDFGSMQAMLQQQQKSSMQMLNIQQQVATQGQEFTAVSNLLKARHDSEMSAVNNFKS